LNELVAVDRRVAQATHPADRALGELRAVRDGDPHDLALVQPRSQILDIDRRGSCASTRWHGLILPSATDSTFEDVP
jgi:hypothetical protein